MPMRHSDWAAAMFCAVDAASPETMSGPWMKSWPAMPATMMIRYSRPPTRAYTCGESFGRSGGVPGEPHRAKKVARGLLPLSLGLLFSTLLRATERLFTVTE